MELIKKELKSWSETLRIDNVPRSPLGNNDLELVLQLVLHDIIGYNPSNPFSCMPLV